MDDLLDCHAQEHTRELEKFRQYVSPQGAKAPYRPPSGSA